ncbi:MAG: MBL fold metallo-hydrolase [Candidatus Wildermuthbacteria bacterium]|nr:MBL fold metallo-hydrolase [Candidatus Wildermuthbacteria bacterium]
MQIIWKGHSCFQVLVARAKQEQVKIVIDPYDESVGFRVPAMEADILLITHDHKDHSNAKAVKGDPFLISNPGEYEVKEVFIRGISSFHDDTNGDARGHNTIYTIEAEDIRICHLGDMGQKELTPRQLEEIGNVHIACVPVGGEYTIGPQEASKIVRQIDPKNPLKLGGVEEFLKAMGVRQSEPQAKLIVKAKDLEGEDTQVVVLTP